MQSGTDVIYNQRVHMEKKHIWKIQNVDYINYYFWYFLFACFEIIIFSDCIHLYVLFYLLKKCKVISFYICVLRNYEIIHTFLLSWHLLRNCILNIINVNRLMVREENVQFYKPFVMIPVSDKFESACSAKVV